MKYSNEISFAAEADEKDPLRHFKKKFLIPKHTDGKDVIYLAGNSLGLQPKTVKDYLEQELKDWAELAVEGHTKAKNPWLPYHEFLTSQTAMIVGAKNEEVVNMNSLTTNLHLLFVSFYRPEKNKHKILIESNSFPSDYYAVESQLRYHGYDPSESLIEIRPRDGEDKVRTEDIEELIEREGDEIALIWIAGVNYYTGQAFEMERIVKAGHRKNCIVGFDLAHAAGNIELKLHEWDADFAVWCNYKYMNGGPGAIGGAFVNERHLNDRSIPKFLGWWGHDKKTRFLMDHKYIPIPTAESWQLSNPPIFQLASLRASLDIFEEAGISALRKKSEMMTAYLEFLINEKNNSGIQIITPQEKNERGCQLSLRIAENGKEKFKRLLDKGVICDWREPDVIRAAPVPLYNGFEDVRKFAGILSEG
ncbi:MAG TPA: kynureninase [Ignavibacteria bacterium]|mgnify:CR=1 FL=1|nr:kynureninase [Bacteroidota bacterium]HRI85594.1 kynureninase [Ignavibacteria bacterium]HRJ98802.1 kynureninase [Ignavibacteria bacterium]